VHPQGGEDDTEAKELGAHSLKTFFGPDKPYIRDRINAYEELLESWGGVLDEHPRIAYASRPTTDRVAKLGQALAAGSRSLDRDPQTGYLKPILEALGVPVAALLKARADDTLWAALRVMAFSDEQRRHVLSLVDSWEEEREAGR